MVIGGELKFEPLCVFPNDVAKAMWLQDWESTEGILLSIQFRGVAGHRIEGSAVMVAPGVALCAAHVVQPHLTALMSGGTGAMCSALTSSGILFWNIRKLTYNEGSDLMILGLELASPLPSGNLFRQAIISTRVPDIGENIVILGFRAEAPVEQLDQKSFMATGNVLLCQGEVTARYDKGRDRAVITWPVIEVDCPSLGGMSGGPAFDRDGYLIGLLATSFSGDGETGPSYVSQISPALSMSFEGGWPAPLFQGRRTLLNMDRRLCVIVDDPSTP
jgi:hypothetical protein